MSEFSGVVSSKQKETTLLSHVFLGGKSNFSLNQIQDRPFIKEASENLGIKFDVPR